MSKTIKQLTITPEPGPHNNSEVFTVSDFECPACTGKGCHDYSGWTAKFKKNFDDPDQQTEMINWLLDKQIPFDRINDNVPGQTELYGNNSRKVHAHLYVDDKHVGGLPRWDEIYDEVCLMEANYKASII